MDYKSFKMADASVDMDARTFSGYAATWDKDQVDDIIQPGAFRKSIAEAFPAKRIKVLWQHREPIGMPAEMLEDDIGLFVKGRVSKTARGDEALELMRDEVVDRMSIGFTIPQGKSEVREDGIRIIREIKLMEFSPVTFPANESAIITGVKSITDAVTSGIHVKNACELMQAIDELRALIKSQEPVDTTPDYDQPLIEDALLALKSLGDFARTRLY